MRILQVNDVANVASNLVAGLDQLGRLTEPRSILLDASAERRPCSVHDQRPRLRTEALSRMGLDAS